MAWTHGTRYGYVKKGCRCAECVEGNRQENKARRRRRRERALADPSIIPHGAAHAVRDYGCHCDLCVKAATDATRKPGVVPHRVFTETEIGEAMEVYRTVGLTAAAEHAGVHPVTVGKWANARGVECYRPPKKHTRGGAYRDGCRCDECVAHVRAENKANAASMRERFARGEIHPPHGSTSTYSNYGCRCEPCRAVWSIRMKEYAAKRKAAA